MFKAKDGKEYRWELRSASLVVSIRSYYDSCDTACLCKPLLLQMITNDTNKTELVRYHHYRPGLTSLAKSRKAYLEIDPRCPEEIMDEVIMTFVYCHKLRKDRQRKTWSNASGQLMRNQ